MSSDTDFGDSTNDSQGYPGRHNRTSDDLVVAFVAHVGILPAAA